MYRMSFKKLWFNSCWVQILK